MEDWACWEMVPLGNWAWETELGVAWSCSKPSGMGWGWNLQSHCERPGGKTPSWEWGMERPRSRIHTLFRTVLAVGTQRPRKLFVLLWVGLCLLVHWRSQIKGTHFLWLCLWYLSGHHVAQFYDNYAKTKKETRKRCQTNVTAVKTIWMKPQSLPDPSGLDVGVLDSTCCSKLPRGMKIQDLPQWPFFPAALPDASPPQGDLFPSSLDACLLEFLT